MLRTVAAVVAGALLMLAINMFGIAGMWFGFGWEFAFDGVGPRASTQWVIGMLSGGLVGAFVGGFVCGALAGKARQSAVVALCAVALVLAVLGASMSKDAEKSRLPEGRAASDLNFAEAGEYAVSPTWYYFLSGVLGPACVWFGGRRRA